MYVEVPQWFTELQPTWIESLKLLKELSGLGLPASTSMFVGAVAGDISWEYLHAGGWHISVAVIKKLDQYFTTATVPAYVVGAKVVTMSTIVDAGVDTFVVVKDTTILSEE